MSVLHVVTGAPKLTPGMGIQGLERALSDLDVMARELSDFRVGHPSVEPLGTSLHERIAGIAAGLTDGAVAVVHNVPEGNTTRLLGSASGMGTLAGQINYLSYHAPASQAGRDIDELVRYWTQPVDGGMPFFERVRSDARAALVELRAGQATTPAPTWTPGMGIQGLERALQNLDEVVRELPGFRVGPSSELGTGLAERVNGIAAGLTDGAVAILRNVEGGHTTRLLGSASGMGKLGGQLGYLTHHAPKSQAGDGIDELVRYWTQAGDDGIPFFERVRSDAQAALVELRAVDPA